MQLPPPQPNEPEWLVVQRQRREESRAGFGGMWTSKPIVVVPALISLPIMAIFGEGHYIVLIMALMWVAVLTYGIWIYRISELGTERRSRGFWIALYSFPLTLLTIGMSILLLCEAIGR